MVPFESSLQLKSLVVSPYHRITDEVTEFRQIPGLDLGELSLRSLVETVDAEYPLGLPYRVVLSKSEEGYYWILEDKHSIRVQIPKEKIGLSIENEVDAFLEAFVPIDEGLTEDFRHITRPFGNGHDTVGTIEFSHPAAHNWRNDYPNHLDGDLQQIAIVTAYPYATEFVEEGFTVSASSFKHLMHRSSPTPPTQAALNTVTHESIEEHAVAFSTDGTFHRKHNFSAEEDAVTQSRALFRSTLQRAA